MIKKHKRFFAVYFAWVFVLFVVLTQTNYWIGYSIIGYSVKEGFWPFCGHWLHQSFEISEFLAYSLAPLVLFGLYLAFKEKE